MKKSLAIAVCLLGATGLYWFVQAGNLEPPGDPESTMITLQQIYDRVDECCAGGGPYGVPKTDQNFCWNATGAEISCAGTGQDAEYKAGVSVDPRFTDNGDGTVTDNLTGLIWLKDADCFGLTTWGISLTDANTLASASDTCTPDLQDGSVAGDWRLPNARELHSLTVFNQVNLGPALEPGHPFSNVRLNYYYSSTSVGGSPDAWVVNFAAPAVFRYDKAGTARVWPVRGGL